MEDAQSVLRDCWNYHDTAGFFAIFHGRLLEEGLTIAVERRFEVPGGKVRRPDFVVLDGDTISDVLDHKASLPNPDRALADLTELRQKYEILVNEGEESTPQVTVLYPVTKQDIVDEIHEELPEGLTLCNFDQVTTDTEIRFRLHGEVNSQLLTEILTGNPLGYRPEIVFSKYKFVRSDPPVVYTAFEAWRLLTTFQSVRTAHRPSFVVDRNQLIGRAQVFYPPWIRNNRQINSNRVNKALQFLDSIDFVDWKPGQPGIVVYSRRGTRSGDLLRYFAERWVRIRQKAGPKRTALVPEYQKTLVDF